MSEGRLCWREGRRICFEWCRRKRKGRFSWRRGAFAGKKSAVSAIGALRGHFGAKGDILAPAEDMCPQGMSASVLAPVVAPYEDNIFIR